jgi:hypothetical protein
MTGRSASRHVSHLSGDRSTRPVVVSPNHRSLVHSSRVRCYNSPCGEVKSSPSSLLPHSEKRPDGESSGFIGGVTLGG